MTRHEGTTAPARRAIQPGIGKASTASSVHGGQIGKAPTASSQRPGRTHHQRNTPREYLAGTSGQAPREGAVRVPQDVPGLRPGRGCPGERRRAYGTNPVRTLVSHVPPAKASRGHPAPGATPTPTDTRQGNERGRGHAGRPQGRPQRPEARRHGTSPPQGTNQRRRGAHAARERGGHDNHHPEAGGHRFYCTPPGREGGKRR